MGLLSTLLFSVGIELGFVYMAMGIFVSGAVIPVTLGLMWTKATNTGAFYGALCGIYSEPFLKGWFYLSFGWL